MASAVWSSVPVESLEREGDGREAILENLDPLAIRLPRGLREVRNREFASDRYDTLLEFSDAIDCFDWATLHGGSSQKTTLPRRR